MNAVSGRVEVLADVLVFIIVDDWDCVVLVGCCVSLIDVVDPSVATVVVGCCVPLTVVED